MATPNPALEQLYPLSTRDGESIPLEVMGVDFLVKKSFALGIGTPFTPPATAQICSFYSLEGCIIQFGTGLVPALADGASYSKTLLVLPDALTVAMVDATVSWIIVPYQTAGSVYIQGMRKWSGLALTQQVKNKG